MNIKPITQKQAQQFWRFKVPLYVSYRWCVVEPREWDIFYPYNSPLTQAKASLPSTLMFGVEVE